MPLVRIELKQGKPPAYRRALADGVYQAMRETINVPENDLFVVVTEREADNFMYDRHYGGIDRTDDFVIIQIALRRGRTTEMKQALYRRVVQHLGDAPGVRPGDVFIALIENGPEDWSFGNGDAQYAK
jgi:phenylpyruvate tautomerase PptA (4-oxalocrotonate tautomerase family)